MHRSDLLKRLEAYNPVFEKEKKFRTSFFAFITDHSDCFLRTLQKGHITGSAWIINKTMTKALLIHHRKLKRWLQPGGHADGDSDIIRIAQKEATEETGLTSLTLCAQNIFDLDVHTIPAYKNVPEHLHYDVRFLFEADETEPLVMNKESRDLAWLPLALLGEYTKENESILRMAEKSKEITSCHLPCW